MNVFDPSHSTVQKTANDYQLEDQVGYKLRLASQRHLEIFSRHLPDMTDCIC